MSYTLIVAPTIEESILRLSEMKGVEKDPLTRDTKKYYSSKTDKVMAVHNNQILCGLQYNGKRPDKAIVYGNVDKDWLNNCLIPSLGRGGEIIYASS